MSSLGGSSSLSFGADGRSADSSNSNSPFATYEATKARQSTRANPDKIYWHGDMAFRDCPYRQLHHQKGYTGLFRVRLLEASDLQRNHWSLLALGPVKHLGLSKAHGSVSSFCTFHMEFRHPQPPEWTVVMPGTQSRKPAATAKNRPKTVVSPVIAQDNNPVWDNFQFEYPLRKGAMPEDGMRVLLKVRVDEDATAMESFLPGVPSGGLIGAGELDLTDLCLGEQTGTGQSLPGVLDAWIPISMEGQEQPDLDDLDLPYDKDDPLAPPGKKKLEARGSNEPPPVTGMVRILVSYTPIGLDPQPKDIVALEAFARRNASRNTCRPLLPPLHALTVLDRRGAYLLCEYTLPSDHDPSHGGRSGSSNNKACVRLHRNAVFVIERQNIVDAAHNLALLPADVWMATPLGQAVAHTSGPVVAASKEVLMPALLSVKLVWMAVRTTGLAGLSGIQALGSTLWREGSQSLTASHERDLPPYNQSAGQGRRSRNDSSRHRAATAQFVQL